MKHENSEPQLLYIDDDGERRESYERVNQGGIGEREIGREWESEKICLRTYCNDLVYFVCGWDLGGDIIFYLSLFRNKILILLEKSS